MHLQCPTPGSINSPAYAVSQFPEMPIALPFPKIPHCSVTDDIVLTGPTEQEGPATLNNMIFECQWVRAKPNTDSGLLPQKEL